MMRRRSSISNYDLGQLLGKGGFASVYRAAPRDGSAHVAIKIIDKQALQDKNAMSRFISEVKIHSRMRHVGVCQMLDVFEDELYHYLVLELVTGGNLYQYIRNNGKVNEDFAASISNQLLGALHYIHSHNVIHRDLKLSNILIDDQLNVKLCDFGLAIQLEHPDEEHFTICGTPNYIAPEIASQRPHGCPADLWSLGCVIYSILTGHAPFEEAGGVKATLDRIISGKYLDPDGLSDLTLDFLRCLLNKKPSQRTSAKELQKHPFLNTNRSKNEQHKKSSFPAASIRDSVETITDPSTVIAAYSDDTLLSSPLKRSTDSLSSFTSFDQSTKAMFETKPNYSADKLAVHTHRAVGRGGSSQMIYNTTSSIISNTISYANSSFGSFESAGRFSESISGLSSFVFDNGSSTSSSSSDKIPKLWIKRNSGFDIKLQPFYHITKTGSVLIISDKSDVVYCTLLRNSHQKEVPYRLCVKSNRPLQLLVGKIGKEMINDLYQLTGFPKNDNIDKSVSKFSSNHITSSNCSLFAEEGGMKSYKVNNIPPALSKIYNQVAAMLEVIRGKIPKLILYISNENKKEIFCKCMLMSNAPFPDFRVVWANRSKLIYNLRNNHVSLVIKDATSEKSYKWDTNNCSLWAQGAPGDAKKYVVMAQKAMNFCLTEDSSKNIANNNAKNSLSYPSAKVLFVKWNGNSCVYS